jgi:hypothetical protein
VEVGRHRAEGLAENDVRAAVQQSDRLRVALDRHRRDGALDAELRELDAHLLGEGAHSALTRPIHAVVDREFSAVIVHLRK